MSMRIVAFIIVALAGVGLACGSKSSTPTPASGGTAPVASSPATPGRPAEPLTGLAAENHRLMETIRKALNSFKLDAEFYPKTNSWEEAVQLLSFGYLKEPITRDGWRHPFLYRSDGQGYVLTSPGNDGDPGTADDIVLEDGQYVPAKLAPAR